MSPQTRAEVVALLERFGRSPRRSLGQHFLVDPNITRKIVATAGVGAGDQVVEVGAGTGTLTVALAEAGVDRVVAYEVDGSLEPLLTEVVAPYASIEVRFRDADELVGWDEAGRWALVANLPYNVGTPLLLDILRQVPAIDRFVVMVQQEVADRLVAGPGSPAYGLPSVVAAIHASGGIAFRVPPQVFLPPPQVGSAVVRLTRRPAPPMADRAIELAAAGFGQRRKMLRRSLAGVLPDPSAVLESASIDPTARAEELSAGEWLRLAEVAGG